MYDHNGTNSAVSIYKNLHSFSEAAATTAIHFNLVNERDVGFTGI